MSLVVALTAASDAHLALPGKAFVATPLCGALREKLNKRKMAKAIEGEWG